jgi:hypothetical protein
LAVERKAEQNKERNSVLGLLRRKKIGQAVGGEAEGSQLNSIKS